MGPTLLFDKSFLQSLSVDESIMLDQMFTCVICPLFFIETMADLTKEPKRGRTPDQIVSGLAERTPVAQSYMNAFHDTLIRHDLLGGQVEMEGRPIVPHGIPVQVDGYMGMVYKQSPEAQAFQRWQQGRFHDVEHISAREWRSTLAEFDLPAIADTFRGIIAKESRPKSHKRAWDMARSILRRPGRNYQIMQMAQEMLSIEPDMSPHIFNAWKHNGSNPLHVYAPYAYLCLEIDLYFYLCISNGIISDQRPSNRIDIGYMYYMPFANVFVSGDKLHRSACNEMSSDECSFIWGPDLKEDLSSLNNHFMSFSDDERAKGLSVLARFPPTGDSGITVSMWDKYRNGWRQQISSVPIIKTPEHDQIISSGNRMMAAARKPQRLQHDQLPPDHSYDRVTIERVMHRQRGSWKMFADHVVGLPPDE